jgi:hypothetical protein
MGTRSRAGRLVFGRHAEFSCRVIPLRWRCQGSSERTVLKTDSLWTAGFGSQSAPKHHMLLLEHVAVEPEPGLLILFGSLLIVAAVALQRFLLRVTRIDSSQEVDPHLP